MHARWDCGYYTPRNSPDIGCLEAGSVKMKHVTEEFIVANPECLDVHRALDLLPLLVEDENLESLEEVLSFTVLVEREYEVLLGFQLRLGRD